MNLSKEGAAFIMREGHEGIRLKPYLCSAGRATIGAGCTTYEDGSKVKLSDPPITQERAVALFWNRAKQYVDAVNKYVKVSLTQYQFDALVSMCFNCGTTEFSHSQVVKYLNQGDLQAVYEWWPKSFVTANGEPVKGLRVRRADELMLFQVGQYG